MIMPLQYLRGIAALMVVYHHAGFHLSKADSSFALPFANMGAAGVDIFFITSGFIMWVTTRNATLTPGDFLRRRLVRIVPLYWAVTLCLLAIAMLAPNLLNTTTFDPWHALLSMLFIPVPHPSMAGDVVPYFIQGWTLNYEMFFYGLFALAMAVNRAAMFTLITAALVAIATASLLWTPETPALRFYGTTLMLEFAAGMALGRLYLRHSAGRGWLAFMLVAAGFAALCLIDMAGFTFGASGVSPERALLWGLPALAIVAGAVYAPGAAGASRAGLLALLGEASYSLYLTHLFTLPALASLWPRLGMSLDGGEAIAFVIAALVLSSVVAVAVFIGFERPLTAWLRDRPRRPARPPATGARLPAE